MVAVQADEAADGVGCSVRGRAGCRGVGGNAVVCAIGGVCGRAVRRGIYALAGLDGDARRDFDFAVGEGRGLHVVGAGGLYAAFAQ